MSKPHKIRRISGLVIHILIAAFVSLAGIFKLAGLIPKEQLDKFQGTGLVENMTLIGAGELIAAILLVIPATSSLGVLLMSGFWGGVISFHLLRHEEFISGSVFMLLTWLGAFLRYPGTFASFYRHEPASAKPVPAPLA
jgi:hypothetical protein